MNNTLADLATRLWPQENATEAPQWMQDLVLFRERAILLLIEPVVVALFGAVEETTDNNIWVGEQAYAPSMTGSFGLEYNETGEFGPHRQLRLLPDYIYEISSTKETMKFKSFGILFATLSTIFLIFLSCFHHDQKTSPLFISPRRHRLPKLVPPPLPVDSFFGWIRVCLLMSDEEIINRIGFDALVFLRFHRLALRCIVKMSVFSFAVLLPLNYTGRGDAGKITGFFRFTMANVTPGSPRLWVHCFAAYLLTAIVVRELLVEYEAYTSIRHRYLLSREPHLRTVLVTNIPRHLRSAKKLTHYFQHVYPSAVRSVHLCQNLTTLEKMVRTRTTVLERLERELLILCRVEKRRLYERNDAYCCSCSSLTRPLRDCGIRHTQDRFTQLYQELCECNDAIAAEQRRRQRVMSMLDRMDAGEGAHDLDYVLAAPFVSEYDPAQRRVLGLPPYEAPNRPTSIPEGDNEEEDVGEAIPSMEKDSNLRSRSPVVGETIDKLEPDGLFIDMDEHDKRKGRGMLKAKNAIRRYGRFTKDVTFLGRPIMSAGSKTDPRGRMEDHVNEVTDKAFVVMRTFTAATIAIQSMHSSKPGSMQVVTAPEPRDVLWENIYVSKGARRTRAILGETLSYLIITLYVIPIGLLSLLVSEKALMSSSPRLRQLHQASALFAAGIQMVQPLCVVALQQLQPPLFMVIGRMEGITSFSEIQMRAFSRYFFFQVLNVFVGTTVFGTIFDVIAEIVKYPENALKGLGFSLPRMSSFFATFVTIKTFIGLGVELVRIMALIQASARHVLFPTATLRRRRTSFFAMRSIDDPGWFPFHKILAQDMLVVVISVVFAVVAPLVLLPCALFCLFSRIMWLHHHMFVYEQVFESGGLFWPKIFRRFVFGLVIAQMTMTGQFILKGARHQAYTTMFLIVLTYLFLRSTRSRYDATSSALPLEVATVMDLSLRHEETDKIDSPRHTTDPGAYIGPHDPFQKAYMQPALRANPRARPEQPFPAAQLGSLDENNATTASPDVVEHDSSASVRLKSLNQEDRRLINRWWDDQLQRAGNQNWLSILAGEECGTLTISGPTRVDGMAPSHHHDDAERCVV